MSNTATLVSSDDQILEHTRSLRMGFINSLAPDNVLPVDKDDRKLLLGLMDGLDRVAVANKRIKADIKGTDVKARANELIAEVLARGSALPLFQSTTAVRELPSDDDSLYPDLVLIPGELDKRTPDTDFDTFMEKNG